MTRGCPLARLNRLLATGWVGCRGMRIRTGWSRWLGGVSPFECGQPGRVRLNCTGILGASGELRAVLLSQVLMDLAEGGRQIIRHTTPQVSVSVKTITSWKGR